MLIGKRVKELRISKGMHQEDLGNELGVTKVSICGYELGKKQPTLDTLIKLSNSLETTPNYLVGHDILVNNFKNKVYVSKDDITFLKEVKKHKNLYLKLKENPEEVIDKIYEKLDSVY